MYRATKESKVYTEATYMARFNSIIYISLLPVSAWKRKRKRKDLKSKEDNVQSVHARGEKKDIIYLTQILPKYLLFGIWDCNVFLLFHSLVCNGDKFSKAGEF